MTQDFAKNTGKDRNRNASRNNNSEQSGSLKPFFIGTCCGILLCLAVQWFVAQEAQQQTSVPEVVESIKEQAAGPVLDFYTRLREVEVLVPDQTEMPIANNMVYLLQAGSFKKAEDADSMRAQLILLNLDADISKFNHNGEIWHRVIVGPFTDRSSMANTRTRLLENGIESLLLTQETDH